MGWVKILSFAVEHRKALAVVVVAFSLLAIGWFSGSAHVQDQWDTEKQAAALAASKQAERQAQASAKVVTEYVDKIKVVHDKGATIIKEVPVYVPASADADCDIHFGFVRLHDAAATNTIPGPAGAADAAPAGVALSTIAATVAANYQRCHENAEQIIAWQQWAMAMGAAAP